MKNNIKELLETTGQTATNIIEKSGISRKTFYSILNDKRSPKIITAEKIARAFGTAVVEVFPQLKEMNE